MHLATGSPWRLQRARETIKSQPMEQTQHPSGSPWRNFYGRFKGKTLRPAQIEALDEDLERLSVPNVSWEVNPDRRQLDLSTLLTQKDLWLEIGFGGGEHLARSRHHPCRSTLLPLCGGRATVLHPVGGGAHWRAEARRCRSGVLHAERSMEGRQADDAGGLG